MDLNKIFLFHRIISLLELNKILNNNVTPTISNRYVKNFEKVAALAQSSTQKYKHDVAYLAIHKTDEKTRYQYRYSMSIQQPNFGIAVPCFI